MQTGLDRDLAVLLSQARAEGHVQTWSRHDADLLVQVGCVTYKLKPHRTEAFLRRLLRTRRVQPFRMAG